MAIIKKSELKQMNEKVMNDRMGELKKELIKINAQIAVGTTPEKPGRVKEIKKTIARMHTKTKLSQSKTNGGKQKA